LPPITPVLASNYRAIVPWMAWVFQGLPSSGGANNLGTIFEFNPNGGTITRLAGFTGAGPGNGAFPYAALTASGNNTFYGTAS